MQVVDNSSKAGVVKQFGISAGTVIPFLLTRAAVRTMGGTIGLRATGIIGGATEAGVSGAVMGVALTPVDQHHHFWENKAKAAGVNAATFFTLGLTGSALSSTSAFATGVGWRTVPVSVARNAIAGMPGGFVNVEANSLSNKNQFDFNPVEVSKGVLNYMAFEGILGAFDSFNAPATPQPPGKTTGEISEQLAEQTNDQIPAGLAEVEKQLIQVPASSQRGEAISAVNKLNLSRTARGGDIKVQIPAEQTLSAEEQKTGSFTPAETALIERTGVNDRYVTGP
jgi:hypothetical protein